MKLNKYHIIFSPLVVGAFFADRLIFFGDVYHQPFSGILLICGAVFLYKLARLVEKRKGKIKYRPFF
jgi:hypothetical protein